MIDKSTQMVLKAAYFVMLHTIRNHATAISSLEHLESCSGVQRFAPACDEVTKSLASTASA